MSILSHIVLSKVVLSKFEPVKGEPFCWIDYSSSPQYLIRRGLAASFNTKENYYTPEVEEYLSRTVETHINQLLDQAPDISDEDIVVFEKSQDMAYSYLEALISRDIAFHKERKESPSEIVMSLTTIMKNEGTLRKRFNVSYLVNQSKVPFTLPSNGIIQINKKALICPISPRVALYFYNSTDNHYKYVDGDDLVMEINRIAFRQAFTNKCSALICSEKSVLDTLKDEFLSDKQQTND